MKTDPLSENSVLIFSDAEQTLTANAGEIILLTGQAGSGKSLWLKRLAGLLELPSHISASINGKSPGKESGIVRMLFDRQPQIWLGQSVSEELCFGLKKRPSPERLIKVLADWGLNELDPASDVATLNRLQAVRLNLAAIALAAPKITLLDNPTDALPEKDALTLRDKVAAWASHSETTVVVACNRWHDWQMVASQQWWVTTTEELPIEGDQQT